MDALRWSIEKSGAKPTPAMGRSGVLKKPPYRERIEEV
jgi:hypothetical protein